MSGRDFYDRVMADKGLRWLGVLEGESSADDVVIVECIQRQLKFAVSIPGILDDESTWDEYLPVLLGKRSASVMTQVSRIVGYFSMINNWNRSKVAELADRRKGDYGVADRPTPRMNVTPFVKTLGWPAPQLSARPIEAVEKAVCAAD